MDTLPAALSVPAASKYLSISRANLYALIKAGALTPAKIGHRTVIRRVDADAFLEKALVSRQQPKPAPRVVDEGIFG
ncbi:helix-turn-helix domain-containing protein [Rhizobium leguminosarum]|uniref:helix-turn-helix domain-containing protein n=1 Tax=Rhizobium leguminosarum TaxID=384 RepID=UPI001C90F240|nr:helix-turn-helix domain-containing protein [Rhizobium leguminosarum]MBY2969519.1 helix-turn-helix domain-containing protein [Rhizobium leguminosarum]MBY2976892.1 helix-turn-helix domain-containing protein [Rhizobium leguminosarum]MBY3005442.1 helix-turn-helix domain-containing protein [Rhizobium leguminosarum]